MKLKLPYGLMVAATLSVSMMSACSDEIGDNDGDASLTAAQFLARVNAATINAQCKGTFQCPEKQGYGLLYSGRFKSEAECKATLNSALDGDNTLKGSIDTGRINYDASAAQRCITKLEDVYAKAICSSETFEEPTECAQVFDGAVTEGGKCFDSKDCAAGFECNLGLDNLCYGTCKASPCAACTDAQACVEVTEGDYSCKDRLAVGASCTVDTPCAQDASCLRNGAEMGKCIADESLDAGGACDEDSQCKSYRCNDSICDAPTPPPKIGASGEACGMFDDLCAPGLSCQDLDAITQRGSCKTVIALGDDCDLTQQCEYGLFCQGATLGMTKGKCAAPLANGQTCKSSDECQSERCDESTKKCVNPMMCSM